MRLYGLLIFLLLLSLGNISNAEVNELQYPHDATNAISCESCHVPYNLIPRPVPANWLMNSVCLSCHRNGSSGSYVQTHIPNGDTVRCETCHNPHTHQPGMTRGFIRTQINTPTGQRRLTFSDTVNFVHGATGGSQPYDGLCETCHSQTDYFRNTASGSHVVPKHQNSVSCTNCHSHNTGFKGACVQCHTASMPAWANSAHGSPVSAQFQLQMGKQSCMSCHVSHAPSDTLSRLRATEETLCYSCHDGTQNNPVETIGARNVYPEFQKTYKHPVLLRSGLHKPDEILPEALASTQRHVECEDCHNPHSLKSTTVAGQINGSLLGESGISRTGQPIASATYEYEVCLKCHGSSANRPANQGNKLTEFTLTNAGFHPVFGPGRNTMPTSPYQVLNSPWTSTSVMKCTDCHGNNDSLGVQGPHGSTYPYILKKNFFMGYGTTESATLYGLCYTCHRRNTYINETQGSRFRYHKKHVQEKKASCYLCHATHGSPTAPHMIRFPTSDPQITATTSGRLEYIQTSTGHGSCYVRCHGKNHNPLSY